MGVGRLQAYVHRDHTASARTADRLGLVPTSTLIDDEILWEAVSTSMTHQQKGAR